MSQKDGVILYTSTKEKDVNSELEEAKNKYI